MLRQIRWIGCLLLLSLLFSGCAENAAQNQSTLNHPVIRVFLLEDAASASVAGSSLRVSLQMQNAEQIISSPRIGALPLYRRPDGWQLGSAHFPTGILQIQPGNDAGIRVNGLAYRGRFLFIPLADGKFNVLNDVDVDDYLRGVVAKEMYPKWPLEALRSQAIVSRTYVLYVAHTDGLTRAWDVYADQRSQVYGGIAAETSASREAVDSTRGIVLTYGPGTGKIFKAYFSSCCGGVSQAASDAFPGDPYIEPLAEHYRGPICSASKYYNWGPIILSKSEVTRRIHAWAVHSSSIQGRAAPELNITGIYRVDVQTVNRYGRPSHVLITDIRGIQYNWPAEQLRTVMNFDPGSGPTLPSSYCKIDAPPGSDSVRFFDGHGYGHGVGMCQWCAEARAEAGWSCVRILTEAFPQAKLIPAY